MTTNFINSNIDNNKSPNEIMAESLDNAGTELQKLIQSCVDDLESFKHDLTSNFKLNLERVVDKLEIYFSNSIDDMVNSNHELIDELKTFEQQELANLTSLQDDVKKKINAKFEQISSKLNELIESSIKSVINLDEDILLELDDNKNKYSDFIQTTFEEHKLNINKEKENIEKSFLTYLEENNQKVSTIIKQSQLDIENQMKTVNELFDSKISEVLKQLTDTVNIIIEDSSNTTSSGIEKLGQEIVLQKKDIDSEISNWNSLINGFQAKLDESIEYKGNHIVNNLSNSISEKTDLFEKELTQILEKSRSKVALVKSEFKTNKRKLETEYFDRLDRLTSKLETIFASDTNLHSDSHIEPLNVLKENLKARVNSHGSEMIKDFQRQINILESEYSRLVSNCHEKIELSRSLSLDGLEKQIRLMKLESQRILKIYKSELQDLENQIQQIDEAGQAAALVVKAYRNSRIKFDLD